jgi:hypothetical protein
MSICIVLKLHREKYIYTGALQCFMSFNITKVLFMVYADGQLETEHHLLLELL